MESNLDKLIGNKKILIMCGSGGVGKTTTSSALASWAAKSGKRVLVLTIDPARRLADAMGIEWLDNREREVPLDKIGVGGREIKGTLHASMLDMKKNFDDLIKRLSSSEELTSRILGNGIYRQVSTALSGSQEYMAMTRLFDVHTSGKYDLVVLDTPPTKHAIDFLRAPLKASNFFEETVMKWFMVPYSVLEKGSFGIFRKGTEVAFKILEKVTGGDFLTELSEFFINFKDLRQDFKEMADKVGELLREEDTGFVLVTNADPIKVNEALFFRKKLDQYGMPFCGFVVNRAFPEHLFDPSVFDELRSEVNIPKSRSLEDIEGFYRKYHAYVKENTRILSRLEGQTRPGEFLKTVPEFDQDVHDFEGLWRIADSLFAVDNPGSLVYS